MHGHITSHECVTSYVCALCSEGVLLATAGFTRPEAGGGTHGLAGVSSASSQRGQ